MEQLVTTIGANYRTIALISHTTKVMLKISPSQASAIHEP